MKKNRDDKFKILFPVLYDTKIYESRIIKSFLRGKRIEILRSYKKGYYNYETNKFEISAKDFRIIEKNPKLAFDLEIIKELGFTIIEQPSDGKSDALEN